jgi:hypothetical protein
LAVSALSDTNKAHARTNLKSQQTRGGREHLGRVVFEAVELQIDQQAGEMQTVIVAAKLGSARERES